MKVKIKSKKARIELIPILDMIFLVLVCFVYTFLSMTVQKGIPVNLPFAKTALEDKKEFLVITIKEDRGIFINKDQVALESLLPALVKYKALDADIKVFLNADKVVPYESVVQVLDAIRQAGIGRVSLETAVDNEE